MHYQRIKSWKSSEKTTNGIPLSQYGKNTISTKKTMIDKKHIMIRRMLLIAFSAVVAASCSKAVNSWVFVKTTVEGAASEADSLAGASVAKQFDKTAYESIRLAPYALFYDRASTLETITSKTDQLYECVKDTVSKTYVLRLKKYISTSTFDEKFGVTLQLYEFRPH